MIGDFHAGHPCKVHFACDVNSIMPETTMEPLAGTDRAYSSAFMCLVLMPVPVPLLGELDGRGRAGSKRYRLTRFLISGII